MPIATIQDATAARAPCVSATIQITATRPLDADPLRPAALLPSVPGSLLSWRFAHHQQTALPVAVTRFRPGTAVTAHLLVAGRMRD